MNDNSSDIETPRSFDGINHISSTNIVHYSVSHEQEKHFFTTADSVFVAKHHG